MKKKRIIKKTLMLFVGIAILLWYFSSSWMTMSVKAYSEIFDQGPNHTWSLASLIDEVKHGESPDNPVYIKLYNDIGCDVCSLFYDGYGVIDLNNHSFYAEPTNTQGPATGVENWRYIDTYVKFMGPGTIDNLNAKAVQRSYGGALYLPSGTLELEGITVSGKTNGVFLKNNSPVSSLYSLSKVPPVTKILSAIKIISFKKVL